MLPDPFRWEGEHLAIDLPGARAVFTTRRGGCSSGPYASLNLGRWTEDSAHDVERNREAVQDALGVRFVFGRQVHGNHVQRTASPPMDPSPAHRAPTPPPADAQVTNQRGLAPMVLSADCLPIALASGGVVAMLHAGWRGLSTDIVAEGVRALSALSGVAPPIAAAIGPGAGRCCYEVSEEVHAQFAARGAGLREGRRLDLKAIAALELQRAGVGLVHDCALCTICSDPDLFFSHRRDGGITGRQAGIVWLS